MEVLSFSCFSNKKFNRLHFVTEEQYSQNDKVWDLEGYPSISNFAAGQIIYPVTVSSLLLSSLHSKFFGAETTCYCTCVVQGVQWGPKCR